MPVPKVVNIKGKPKPKYKDAKNASKVESKPGPPTSGDGRGNGTRSSNSPAAPSTPAPIVVPTAVVNFEDINPAFREIVDSMYHDRVAAKKQEDYWTEARKNVDELLDGVMLDLNVGKIVMPDGFVISLIKSSSASKVDAKLLLALGVAADTIKAATVPGNPYKYVLVADRNKKEQD